MEEYYTPDIKEFVEGFEFEYYGDRVNNNRWHKAVFGDKWSYISILSKLNGYSSPVIRAKRKGVRRKFKIF